MIDWSTLGRRARALARSAAGALGAGPVHRRRLDGFDIRVAVSGVRGKSTVTEWLHDEFVRRGYDTVAKITGSEAKMLHNGTVHEIDRDGQVRLYENERELGRFEEADVAVVENQGIRQYTTRLVNERFVDPDVVFLTNVREDHLDTLGSDRVSIARSLTRAVPRGTPVVCGEQGDTLRQYVGAELARRDAPVTFVDPPPEVATVPGVECVYGVSDVLRTLDERPLEPAVARERVESMRPAWTRLPGGRVFDAASVNDVQSTERIRRSLVTEGTVVEPLVNLRWDRRGRTASFIRYIDDLYDAGAIERVHVTGDDQHLLATNVSVPVRPHDTDELPADAVLDEALSAGRPVLLMGNTVTEFMTELLAEIEARAATYEAEPKIRAPPEVQ